MKKAFCKLMIAMILYLLLSVIAIGASEDEVAASWIINAMAIPFSIACIGLFFDGVEVK